MSIKVLLYGLELCALLDSAAHRNVLPFHHFDAIPAESRPHIQPSTVKVLQGIGPKGLTVMGEATLPAELHHSRHSRGHRGYPGAPFFCGRHVPTWTTAAER